MSDPALVSPVIPPSLACALIALLIRLPSLANRDLGLDELFSWLFLGLSPLDLLRPSTTLPHAPLFFLLMSLLPSDSPDWLLRLPSLLFGAILVGTAAHWVEKTRSRGAGWIVGLCLALNPLNVYWSGEYRMYSLYAVLAALPCLAIAAGRLPGRWWGPLWAGSFFTFPYAVFHAPWLLWEAWRRRDRAAAVSLALAALPVAAWLVPAQLYLSDATLFVAFDRLTPRLLIVFLKTTIAGNFNAHYPELKYALWGGLTFGSLAFLCGVLRAARRPGLERDLLAASLMPLGFFLVAQYLVDPGFTYRSFYPSSVLIVVVAALGLSALPSRSARLLLSGGLFLSWMLAVLLYFDTSCRYNWNTPRDRDARALARELSPRVYEGAVLHFDSLFELMTFLRYLPSVAGPRYIAPEEFDRQIQPYEKDFFHRAFASRDVRVGRAWGDAPHPDTVIVIGTGAISRAAPPGYVVGEIASAGGVDAAVFVRGASERGSAIRE